MKLPAGKHHSGIDEVHTLVGAGGVEGGMDAANPLGLPWHEVNHKVPGSHHPG